MHKSKMLRQVIRLVKDMGRNREEGVQPVCDDDEFFLMIHKVATILNATVSNFSKTVKGSGEMACD